MERRERVGRLRELWGASLAGISDDEKIVSDANDMTYALKELLAFFESEHARALVAFRGVAREDLASKNGRDGWLKAIEAALAEREVRRAKEDIDRIFETVRSMRAASDVHPCVPELEKAVRTRDVPAWREAWEQRKRVRRDQELLAQYEQLLDRVTAACPRLGELLRTTSGDEVSLPRVSKLREAWNWAAAREWLRTFSSATAYERRVRDYHLVKKKIEDATERLVARRAWKAFFDRLDERTLQSLEAWTRAVARIGKGTGKHAHRHRRTARQYLMDCVPKIPAWIMPLHKLWDSVDAVPGLFDTVIVDEASQASVDALVLFLLAKRIVVVGDDKQNSPEAVGVREEDIARLARDHLKVFRFRDEYRPDTSLFDHTKRTFTNHVTLREHFRCVPEIIRFSNDLCYRDTPLIPLRQAPPKRLPPLRHRFVPEGRCEGEGARICNRSEAEALVETILKLVQDPAYKGKTMGVITLQGRGQAQLIERFLVDKLDPRIIEERRLRCGEPASFQGDERDVILLSLVVAPNVRFRALTTLPDVRRFNVAMSRARDQVWLFYSVKTHDLSPGDLRYRLVSFFENPQNSAAHELLEDLERLERQTRENARRRGTQPEPYDSWFEVDMALELLRRRFRIRPQVEVAGYRIDLVVEGVGARLAIECDGDEWHGLEQFERDMARQRQLERAGWRFVRVRASEFYLDRERAIKAVVEACEDLGIRPVDFSEASQQVAATAAGSVVKTSATFSQEGGAPGGDAEDDNVEPEASPSSDTPFARYSVASAFPDPREAPRSAVREALRQIIEQDGPLSRASVYRLYIECCPDLQRAGKAVRQALDKALRAMLSAGEIVEEDELGDGSPESRVLRTAGAPKVRLRPAGERDLLEIPPSELLEVLRRIRGEAVAGGEQAPEGGGQEVLFRALLKHYGFKKLTKPRREYLSRVLRHLSAAPSS